MKPNSVVPPILFGLGVEIDDTTGSKMLFTEISKLEYAISYDEVKGYKQSVLMHEDHKLDNIKDGFTKFVADSLGNNTDTLDGIGTSHWMGKLLVQS